MGPQEQQRAVRAQLRRSVLAATLLGVGAHDPAGLVRPVLDDVQLDDDAILTPGAPLLPWSVVAPAAAVGVEAVRDLLLAHVLLHADVLEHPVRVVPHALPRPEARALAGVWDSRPVPGDALDLGLGVVLPLAPAGATERVLPVPRASAPTGRPLVLGPEHLDLLERAGELTAQRLRRDAGRRGGDVLRPVAGCEVPTLLAARSLRLALTSDPAARVPQLRAVAVPTRTRGWLELSHVDPAFVAAAWAATVPHERGLPRPLLLTRDEVGLARSVRSGSATPDP